MYDARGGTSGSDDSNLLFAGITIAVVVGAFLAVLMWPSNSSKSPIAQNQAAEEAYSSALATALPDPDTRRYVVALNRTSPKSAQRLEASVASALEDGASKDDLAMMVMTDMNPQLLKELMVLEKAHVKHINALLDHSQTSLESLSKTGSKWCKASTYEKFETMSEARIIAELGQAVRYDSDLYRMSMKGNALILEAAADARENPVKHGALRAEDEAAMQSMVMKIMFDPQIQNIMAASSAGSSSAALQNVNVCSIATSVLRSVDSLPNDTKARLWAEGFRQANMGGLEKALGQVGGF